MFKLIFKLFFLLIAIPLLGQRYTIDGIVKDASSGESLPSANIHIPGMGTGVTSNTYGYYSITLPNGNYQVVFSYIGHKPDTLTVNLTKDITYNIDLDPSISELKELVISDTKYEDKHSPVSNHRISARQIADMPAVAGESDLLKSIQLLPGVQTSHEGTTNLSIRGGSHDQNLYLVDGAPVYNPNHILSLVSAFNTEAIKSVDVYKGIFPAQYGGRLSSVIDVRMKEGNNRDFKFTGNVGIAVAGITLEKPIVKGKSSVLVSGRYSYAGLVANLAGKFLNTFPSNSTITFYDINLKVNHEINSKNKVYLSLYSGRDRFAFKLLGNGNRLSWGNNAVTLRWNHIYGNRLFSNYKLTYSDYRYDNSILDDARNFDWKSNMNELGNYIDFDWYPHPSHSVKFGVGIIYHGYRPGILQKRDSTSVIKNIDLGRQQALDNAIYFSDNIKIGKKINLSAGLRYSNFYKLGRGKSYRYDALRQKTTDTVYYKSGEVMHFYHGLEPRLSLSYLLTKASTISIAYARTVQYLHLMSNSAIGIPTDVWLPSGRHFRPITARQVVGGYTFNIGKIGLSLEGYYREMNNVIDYIDNADLFINEQIETQIVSGKRKAYGIEFKIDKRVGKFSGWMSYTYSDVVQKMEAINNNEWYPTTFNKPHNFSVNGTYKIGKYWKCSVLFKYTSGGYGTVPFQKFYINDAAFVQYTTRNNFEKPVYHRLDISVTYLRGLKKNKKVRGEWSLGVYNVYNRKNAFALLVDHVQIAELEAKQLSLYGIVPSLNYKISF